MIKINILKNNKPCKKLEIQFADLLQQSIKRNKLLDAASLLYDVETLKNITILKKEDFINTIVQITCG
jgi:hypothetical protein